MAPCAAPEGRPCLVWVIDQAPLPDATPETKVTGNVYATTIVQGQVLVLSSPVLGQTTDVQVASHLLEILASFDARPSPVRPDAEAQRLRSAAP